MKRILLPILVIGILLLSACVETTTPPAPSPAPAPTPTPSPQPAPAPAPDVPQQKVKDIETIMGRAERLGIKVQSIAHVGSSITIACQADSYTTFRDYKAALEESGRFSTHIAPPEGFPYVKGGSITLEPKFQYIDMPAVYHEVNLALSPLEVPAAIVILVGIAEESGINVDPASGKFNVPAPGGTAKQTGGGGTYQVLPFRNIKVQGNYENVIAFISNLDSGKTLKTAILARVSISQIEVNSKIETIAIVDVDIYER